MNIVKQVCERLKSDGYIQATIARECKVNEAYICRINQDKGCSLKIASRLYNCFPNYFAEEEKEILQSIKLRKQAGSNRAKTLRIVNSFIRCLDQEVTQKTYNFDNICEIHKTAVVSLEKLLESCKEYLQFKKEYVE